MTIEVVYDKFGFNNMVLALETRMIGRRQTTYKPENGFEFYLGNKPINVIEKTLIILESNSKIKNLQILRLEDKDNLIRKIALLEDKDGQKTAVYFYQDDYKPKGNRQRAHLSYNVFGDTATVGEVRVISTSSKQNIDKDYLFEADKLTTQLANNSKKLGLRNNEIQLSGSGAVIVTDLNRNDFINSIDLQQAIGELFREDGQFKNNLILPSIETKKLTENMIISGAKVLQIPSGFPDLIDFLDSILRTINTNVTKEMMSRALPLLVYVPYHAQYFTSESTDLLLGYVETEFKNNRIKYVKKQIELKLRSLFTEFILN